MHKAKPPHKIAPGKLAQRKKPPMYTLGDLTEAAKHQAKEMLRNPPEFTKPKDQRSQAPPQGQQENQIINDIISPKQG